MRLAVCVLVLCAAGCTESTTADTGATSLATTPAAGTAVPEGVLGRGAPPVELESYRSELVIDIEMAETTAHIAASGARQGERFECTTEYVVDGESRTERIAGDADDVWLGEGSLLPSRYAEADVAAVLSICPAATDFWVELEVGRLDEVTALEVVEVNGVTAARYDLAAAIADSLLIGVVPELSGVEYTALQVWRQLDTGAIVRLVLAMEADASTLAGSLGLDDADVEGTASMRLTLDVTSVDDPTVAVTLPG